MRYPHGFLGALATVIVVALPAPALASESPVQHTETYLVEHDGTDAVGALEALEAVGATPEETYTRALDGFAVELTDAQARWLSYDDDVTSLTAVPTMHIAETEPDPITTATSGTSETTVQSSPTWGLDQLDQAAHTSDGSYSYPTSAGSGVTVYVMDTGVLAGLPDFGGRVTSGYSALDTATSATTDANGHGTHVAGTVASTTYGVAKLATIVPVQVVGSDGSGSGIDFLEGVEWILDHHEVETPGVVNVSLAFKEMWEPADEAVRELVDAGIFVAVAAGNVAGDACSYSPAASSSAFTTGAVNTSGSRVSFSNYGSCVDGFAPGAAVTSWGVDGRPVAKYGTSMASPHVAGLAALYLGQEPAADPAAVTTGLLAGASSTVTDAGADTTTDRVTTLSLPVVGTPTDVQVETGTTSISASWNPPKPLTAKTPTSYTASARTVSTGVLAATTTVPAAAATATLTGLAGSTSYAVTVRASDGTYFGPTSAAVTVTTSAATPSAVRSATITQATASSISLAWDAPVPVSGAAVVGYTVSYREVGAANRATTSTSTTTATVSSLEPETAYEFTITPLSASASGPTSEILTGATTTAVPDAPGGLVLAGSTYDSVTLTWDAAVARPGAPVTGYTLRWRAVGASTWARRDTGAATNATLEDLAHDQAYEVQVTATAGTSAESPAATLTVRTPVAVPQAPTGVVVTQASATELSLSWTAPEATAEAPVTGYQVAHRASGGSTWSTQTTTGTSATVSGLSKGTSYDFAVAATSDLVAGESSAIVTVSTPATVPGVPGRPSVTAPSPTSITVSWVAPPDTGGSVVTGYRVQLRRGSTLVSTRTLTGTARTATFTALSADTAYTATVAATNAVGTGASSSSSAAVTTPPPGIVTLTPTRLLDNRSVTPNTVRCIQVTGKAGVPTGATGVALNVTTVAPTGAGYVVVYPDSSGNGRTAAPNASSVNFEPGRDVANSAFVALPSDGKICYRTAGAQRSGVVLDVTGYLTPDSGVSLMTAKRVLDTRSSSSAISSALSARRTYTVAVAGKSGVPSNATGVIVNATVLGGAVGYLQVWPGKQTRPATSVVNYASADKANAIVVALGSSGTISLYSMSSSKVHVILDVVGYLTDGSTLRAADPVRAVDTRSGSGHTGTISTSLSPRKVYAVDLSATVPADATGVVLNVIAIEPSANGNLRVYPDTNGKGTTSPPQASSLNYVPGRAIPNLVVVNLPANGKVDFYSDTSTRVHLAVDVVGYVTE